MIDSNGQNIVDNTSADLRAPSVDAHRFRSRAAKYDSFQNVNAGQVGAPHYEPIAEHTFCLPVFPANLAEAKVSALKKRDLWKEAQWAGPPRHHRSYRADKWGNSPKYGRRREAERGRRGIHRVKGTADVGDPEMLAEMDLRDEELRRVVMGDYDEQGEEVERRAEEKGMYGVLFDRAHEGWEKKRTKIAEKAGWDLLSDVASVQSDETDVERDRDGHESEFELV